MNESTERWLPVVGWESSYQVSDLGRVRSIDRLDLRGHRQRGKILKPRPTGDGHQKVALCGAGIRHDRHIHQLVIEAFVGPRPERHEVRHLNGIPDDNRLSNLSYGTRGQNLRDRVLHGTDHNVTKTECPAGHPYDSVNTYLHPTGRRCCRACGAERMRKKRLLKHRSNLPTSQ